MRVLIHNYSNSKNTKFYAVRILSTEYTVIVRCSGVTSHVGTRGDADEVRASPQLGWRRGVVLICALFKLR